MCMKSAYKLVLVAVVAAVLAGSISFILLKPPEAVQVVFEQDIELYFYVDEAGNARGVYVGRVLSPKLEELVRLSITLMGTDRAEQSYMESLLSAYARYGLELRNLTCEIAGLTPGENLTITLTWETPNFARRGENGWTITSEWIDAQEAAKEVIAEAESSWVTYRHIARYLGAPDALFSTTARGHIVLPENAENIVFPALGSSYFIDYGGGTWENGSLHSTQIDGRFAAVGKSLKLIATEKEFTITPEQLRENYLTLTVSYDMPYFENITFVSSVNQVRLDLKYGRELADNYWVYSDGSWHPLSPAQVLYYAADAIITINQGRQFLISQPLVPVAPPTDENGEWTTAWEKLSKSQYIVLAQAIRENVTLTGRAPGTIETPIGEIRFRDALYTFLRILTAYAENGVLPAELTFAPVPTGNLALDGGEIPASYAYYLLPDPLVITGTDMVNEVLDNVRPPVYDDRKLAMKISKWLHENLTPALSFRPPTSEEVLVLREGQCRDYVNAYLALTRTAGIPARRVSGWIVVEWTPPPGLWEIAIGTTPDGRPIGGHAWAQVFIDGEWVSLDPTWGWFETPTYEIYKQVEQSWRGALAGHETGHGVL
jgi:transglutaminase-like putative cysteine protease